jgi:uncharacterized circularly permuted ATP-grasp superfamily protein/uncharacterized alpha-E superfamily protein
MSRTERDATASSLIQGYFGSSTLLDEAFEENGTIREHYRKVIANADELGGQELRNRQQELLNLLKENGVTYNIYGDPNGLNRPWQLDTMPLVIRASDWKVVEKGMKQRAYVLDKLLQDLYGERRLLKERIIPPELIYAHSGFLRPCDNIRLPGRHQLILYAADLSRGPDGKVWLLRDRTQAPSGMGYALENRSALGRIVPELFKGHSVNGLGGFYNGLMDAFSEIAPQGKDQPRVVLLTPGPRNETYFEHAFLSSNLGFTLVQGEDLLVRDGYVWIKTVEGLEKVDIILRRIDDSFCDPLELREDSQLGVPGLLEVIRNGHVAVANPIGSGVLENTGLLAFMHSVFRYYLNEDPVFPMVATWWCGQKKELSHVLANFSNLVIKKIDRVAGTDTYIGSQLSAKEKADLIDRIKAQPYRYVGQEAVNLSTSPVLMKDKLEPRYTVMRTFLVANSDGYTVMPGGLSRCAPETGSLIVTNQEGGISKDTWIESKSVESGPHLLHRYDLNRTSVLPSRAAENLFWVGRYAQRIIRISRFMRMVLRNLTQSSSSADSESVKALLRTVTHLTSSYPGFLEDGEDMPLPRKFDAMHQLFCDVNFPGSIVSNVNNLLRATYAVRDKWTVDNWKIIDDIDTIKNKLDVLDAKDVRHIFSLSDQLTRAILSFVEMNRQSLYRGEGWMMYRIGQLIEEVEVELTQYRSLLTFEFEENVEFQILEALLTSNQNLSNYRAVYRTYFDTAPAIDLLFFNRKNPISILMQLEQLLEYVEKLPQSDNNKEVPNLAFECYSMVRLASLQPLLETDPDTQFRSALDEFCGKLTGNLGKLSAKLSARYFRHSTYRQQAIGEGFEFEV